MEKKLYKYSVHTELSLMIVKFFGSVTLADLIDFTKSIVEHPEYAPQYDVLFDFSDSLALGYRFEVNDFVKMHQQIVPIDSVKKYGIVYKTINQKIIFSLFKTFGKKMNLEINNFKNIDDCIEWLGVDEEKKEDVLNFLNNLKKAYQND